MTKVRSALVFSILTQHSRQVINLFTIIILARLLTPTEIGVFAVASSLVFLAIELRALGVGQYLIREKEIDKEKIRSALGLMILVSWGMALIIAISAPYIADFYNEQALTVILWIIAGTFLFTPFSSLPDALLTREMKFKPLFIVKISSTIILSSSSIILVLLGYSYYGLAMGVMIGGIAHVLLISFYRPKDMPWLPSFSGLKKLLKFGALTSTASTLQQFSLSIPDLVLGRVATMADVGLFSRGLGVVVFLNNILGKAVAPVVLPHLSEIKRAGGDVGEAYLRAVVLLTAICWPIFAVVNLCAYSLIRALFGDQWDVAVPIASALAIWAVLQVTHSFSSYALIAVGKEKLMLKKEVIIFIIRFAAVLSAAPYGILMVAWAMVMAGIAELLINSWAIKKSIGIGYRRLAQDLLPSLIVTVICWGFLKLLSLFIPFESLNSWISLIIVGITMIPVWLLSLRITKHEAWTVVIQMTNRLIPSK